MKLTLQAYSRRRREDRLRLGRRYAVRRVHPGTHLKIVQPVEMVERVLPADCEHDDIAVVRAGVFDGRYMARCRDCNVPGPVVDAQTCLTMGVDIVEYAGTELLRLHPRASFREARDEGGLWGWAETHDGAMWFAMSGAGADAHGVSIGVHADPESAVRAVLSWWNRLPELPPRVGCVHCGADALQVEDFCPRCARGICGGCLTESTELRCGMRRQAVQRG